MDQTLSKFTLVLLIFFMGCSGDPCEDVFCGPGFCDNGICICPDGYTGSSCELLVNDSYFGKFDIVSQECDPTSIVGINGFRIQHKPGGTAYEVSIEFVGTSAGEVFGTLQDGKLESLSGEVGNTLNIEGEFIDLDRLECVFELSNFVSCNFVLLRG